MVKSLTNASIALREGASDEKRMMVQRIENRLARLQDELDAFEALEEVA